MLGVLVTPRPTNFDERDFKLLDVKPVDNVNSKFIYYNVHWFETVKDHLFGAGNWENSLTVLKNEIGKTTDLLTSLRQWFDDTLTHEVSEEELVEIEALVSLLRKPKLMSALALEPALQGSNTSIADVMFINSLDYLLQISKSESGGR